MKTLTKSQKVEKENILNEIFNTDEFNLLDVEKEKKEIEALGWNYENLIKFGKELGKKIK